MQFRVLRSDDERGRLEFGPVHQPGPGRTGRAARHGAVRLNYQPTLVNFRFEY